MITDQDIDKLKQVFATKEDLKAYATKEDLKVYATKEDLLNMERGIRLDMATKTDLRNMEKSIRRDMATKADLIEMKDLIIGAIVTEIKSIYEKLAANEELGKRNAREIRGHRVAIGDHEKRLMSLT